jgi:hypothetical protein
MRTIKSNVTIRPNVYVRTENDIEKDKRFVSQVRGRTALMRLLKHIAPSGDLNSSAKLRLSQRQVAELAWELPCSDCGSFPEGPVDRHGEESIEFRCPKHICVLQRTVGRIVMLPVGLANRLVMKDRRPISDIISDALLAYAGNSSRLSDLKETGKLPFAIRLTRTQNYLFSDQEIQTAISEWLGGDEDE